MTKVFGGPSSCFCSPDFGHCRSAGAGLFQVPTQYSPTQGEKGLIPSRGCAQPHQWVLSSRAATFPTRTQSHVKQVFAGDSGSPAAVGQQSLADTPAGKTKSSFVPFPLSPRQWHDSAGVKCFNGIQDSFCCPPAPRPFHPSLGARTNSQEEKACCVLHQLPDD